MVRGLGIAVPAVIAGGAALRLAPAYAQPKFAVSAAVVQAAVAQKFPLQFPVPGLFELEVQTPVLRWLAEQNRIGAEAAIVVGGEVLRRRHIGTLDMGFALRYEGRDRTIRAHAIRINALRFPSLRTEVTDLLDQYVPALLAQSLLEIVVYQLKPADLVLPDGLGLRPDTIRITADGLVVEFVPKQP